MHLVCLLHRLSLVVYLGPSWFCFWPPCHPLLLPQVHIALCLDQYSRWGVEQLARDNFMFLQQSQPLDLSEWRGYVPRRGLLDGGFPADRAVVYSFALHLPSVHVANVERLQMRMRVMAAQALRRRQSSSSGGCEGGKGHNSVVKITASSATDPSDVLHAL